nr:expressed protein [Hymenolepis microstoma]
MKTAPAYTAPTVNSLCSIWADANKMQVTEVRQLQVHSCRLLLLILLLLLYNPLVGPSLSSSAMDYLEEEDEDELEDSSSEPSVSLKVALAIAMTVATPLLLLVIIIICYCYCHRKQKNRLNDCQL